MQSSITVAHRKSRRVTTGGSGCAALIFVLLGLLCCLVGFPFGLLPGLLLIAVGMAVDSRKGWVHFCGACGNDVAPTSLQCPTCRTPLVKAPAGFDPGWAAASLFLVATLGYVGWSNLATQQEDRRGGPDAGADLPPLPARNVTQTAAMPWPIGNPLEDGSIPAVKAFVLQRVPNARFLDWENQGTDIAARCTVTFEIYHSDALTEEMKWAFIFDGRYTTLRDFMDVNTGAPIPMLASQPMPKQTSKLQINLQDGAVAQARAWLESNAQQHGYSLLSSQWKTRMKGEVVSTEASFTLLKNGGGQVEHRWRFIFTRGAGSLVAVDDQNSGKSIFRSDNDVLLSIAKVWVPGFK